MTKRTDIHRKSAVVASDYDYVLSYSLPTTLGGWPVPAINVDLALALQASEPFAAHGSLTNCTLCGAHYGYGDIWKHRATGEHVWVGHDCADNVGWAVDRSEYDGLRLVIVNAIKADKKLHAKCDGNEALFAALRDAVHPVLVDMRAKLLKYGRMSEKAVKYALYLAGDGGEKPAGLATAAVKWVAVTGDTYPVKEQLKALGARWDSYERVWRVREEKLAQATALLLPVAPADETNEDDDGTLADNGTTMEAAAAALPF